jgi:hypothetical protein
MPTLAPGRARYPGLLSHQEVGVSIIVSTHCAGCSTVFLFVSVVVSRNFYMLEIILWDHVLLKQLSLKYLDTVIIFFSICNAAVNYYGNFP